MIEVMVLTALAACGQGGLSHDSEGDSPIPIVFEEGPPISSDTWDGLFQYEITSGYVYSDDGLSPLSDPLADAYGWGSADPLASWSLPAFFDESDDRCWHVVGSLAVSGYRDLGSSLSFRVDVNEASLVREDMGGTGVEYWWAPMNIPAWAIQPESSLTFQDVATDIHVPSLLDLSGYDDVWAKYLQTGDLHIVWDAGTDESRVRVSRYEGDGSLSLCSLLDDGDATIPFVVPSSDNDQERYLFLDRVRHSAIDVDGVGHVFVMAVASLTTRID